MPPLSEAANASVWKISASSGLIPMEEMVRRPDVFGPPVEVAADAPMQDRAMAWFGRQP